MSRYKKNMRTVLTVFLLLLALVFGGCSDGGGHNDTSASGDEDIAPTSYTAGVWTGTRTSDDEITKVLAIMPSQPTEDAGWLLSMDESYSPYQFTRFQSAADPSNVEYLADGTRYYLSNYLPENVAVSGTFSDDGSFAVVVDDEASLLHHDDTFDQAADIAETAHVWSGSYGNQGAVTLTVAGDGSFNGVRENNPSCTFTGRFSAHAEQALYDVVFDETLCDGNYLQGVAFVAAPLSRIYLVLTTENGGEGAIFVGEKSNEE